jgi:hypothetical protein
MKILPFLLTATTAWGQVSWMAMGGGHRGLPDLQGLRETLAETSTPQWVVLDAPDGSWVRAFRSLARKEPLAALDLPILQVEAADGAARELAEQQAWSPGPHWALMDPQARVLAQGGSLPTARQLGEAFDGTGRPSTLTALRRFVKEHPEQLEARGELVMKLKRIAAARTLEFLGRQLQEPSREQTMSMGDDSGFEFRTHATEEEKLASDLAQGPAQALPGTEDEEIWGEYARELQGFFETDAWAALEFDASYKAPHGIQPAFATPLARVSGVCQRAYKGLLPGIEALLRRYPSAGYPLSLYVGFAGPAGVPLGPLLEKLDPPPGAASPWPPVFLRRALRDEARARQDWTAVITLSRAHWDQLLESIRGEEAFLAGHKGLDRAPTPWLNELQWETLAEPYLEGLIRQGRTQDASQLMGEWTAHRGWSGAYDRAAAMADRAGLKSLGDGWRGKRPATP